jgi:hypothetical protein
MNSTGVLDSLLPESDAFWSVSSVGISNAASLEGVGKQGIDGRF